MRKFSFSFRSKLNNTPSGEITNPEQPSTVESKYNYLLTLDLQDEYLNSLGLGR